MKLSRSKRNVNGVRVNVYVVNGEVYWTKKDAYAALGVKAERKPRNDRKVAGMEHLSTVEYDVLKRRLDAPKHNSLRALRKPGWFSEWDEFVEEEARNLAYMQEACTGIKWDVDHLLPLHAKEVSGLHCADNLQVIPATLNRRKHNKLKYTERMEWLSELKA